MAECGNSWVRESEDDQNTLSLNKDGINRPANMEEGSSQDLSYRQLQATRNAESRRKSSLGKKTPSGYPVLNNQPCTNTDTKNRFRLSRLHL